MKKDEKAKKLKELYDILVKGVSQAGLANSSAQMQLIVTVEQARLLKESVLGNYMNVTSPIEAGGKTIECKTKEEVKEEEKIKEEKKEK